MNKDTKTKIIEAINYANATNMIEDNELSPLEKDLIKRAIEESKTGKSLINCIIGEMGEKDHVKVK